MIQSLVFSGVCEVLPPLTKFYFSGNPDDADKSNALTNRDFTSLSEKIGGDWKRFARQFNIEDNKIADITKKSDRELDGCFQVFRGLEARDGSVKWKPIKMALEELALDRVISEYLSEKQRSNEYV